MILYTIGLYLYLCVCARCCVQKTMCNIRFDIVRRAGRKHRRGWRSSSRNWFSVARRIEGGRMARVQRADVLLSIVHGHKKVTTTHTNTHTHQQTRKTGLGKQLAIVCRLATRLIPYICLMYTYIDPFVYAQFELGSTHESTT